MSGEWFVRRAQSFLGACEFKGNRKAIQRTQNRGAAFKRLAGLFVQGCAAYSLAEMEGLLNVDGPGDR